MENNFTNNFLQSEEWRNFQESVGRKTFNITSPQPSPSKGEGAISFQASIIEYQLPLVGGYFYVPRGPIISKESNDEILKHLPAGRHGVQHDMQDLVELAKKEKAGWIRIEPKNQNDLKLIISHLTDLIPNPSPSKGEGEKRGRRGGYQVVKAPHDMQPKETLVLDISKSEEELLSQMKSKTRYNIKLAEKKGIKVFNNCHPELVSGSDSEMPKQVRHDKDFFVEEFLRLNKIMAERQGIKTHNDEYYRKMLETIPEKNIKLYVAEYKGEVIAANLVIFYGDTATYLHGASDDKYKNLMAPYLLQWRQIQDAKKAGCAKYDFFGVKVKDKNGKSWAGITRFKLGFAPNEQIVEFPGSYDIVICPGKYWIYRIIQKIKSFIR